MKIYLVGGAVRDMLMGLEPKDRDYVVVGATPEDMLKKGFKQVGADFPVFLHPETGEEYALARVERKTGVGYHGFEVSTENVTIEEDLSRRDLTINSIAREYNPTSWGATLGEIVDPFGGVTDLENKVLRHTSEAFSEDPLRVVRLARFAARYTDFIIANETSSQCAQMVLGGDLNELPYERFWAELEKVVHEPGLHRFLELIDGWDGFTRIKFFDEIFGRQSEDVDHYEWVQAMCEGIKDVSKDIRRDVLVAILAKNKPISPAGATSDFLKLHRHILMLNAMRGCKQYERVERVFELMKSVKPWGEGPHFDYLLTAAVVMDRKFPPPLNFVHLHRIGQAMKRIKADQFPNLQGKALGEAIDKARKINVELCL